MYLLFLAATSFAQIQYFPTIIYDLDGDGFEDVILERGFSQSMDASIEYCSIHPQNNVEIANTRIQWEYGSGHYIQYFEFNDTISENSDWTEDSETVYEKYYNQPKSWWLSNDYFAGVRIKKDDLYYYGWIRFKGNTPYNEVLVRDAAIQSTPNTSIKAGEGITSIAPVSGLVTVNGDNSKWSDFNFEFYPSYYYSFVNSYRAFIVKNENSSEINIDDLLNVPTGNYLEFNSGESFYNFDLNDSLLDLDNETIKLGGSYQICILAITNHVDSFQNAFTLTDTFVANVTLPNIESPVVLDNSDFGNSKDIQIIFKKNENEDFLKEYRVLILPSDSTSSFNLEKALAVSTENSYTIPPSNDSIYTIINMSITDIYGISIQQNKLYKAFILSVQDNINSNVSSLSFASNDFALSNPDYIYASQTEGESIMHNGGEVTINGDTCTLDFDKDGQLDIMISGLLWDENNHPRINTLIHPAENIQIIYSEENLAKNISLYSPINNYWNWSSEILTLYYEKTDFGVGTIYGEFKTYRDGIIGFKKSSVEDTILGWLRINNGRIKEYAWQKAGISSISEIPNSTETSFIPYPNPNRERILNISIKEYKEGVDYYIDVLNPTGTLQHTFKITAQLSEISLANLNQGLYYFRLRSPDKQETQKIIVL